MHHGPDGGVVGFSTPGLLGGSVFHATGAPDSRGLFDDPFGDGPEDDGLFDGPGLFDD